MAISMFMGISIEGEESVGFRIGIRVTVEEIQTTKRGRTMIEEFWLSQMATYWFVIAWFDNQSIQKSKVRQAAKDVVKSEIYPQTYTF